MHSLDKARELISQNDELELNMLVYAHGIIMMKSFGTLTLGWEQIHKMILNAYERFQLKKA